MKGKLFTIILAEWKHIHLHESIGLGGGWTNNIVKGGIPSLLLLLRLSRCCTCCCGRTGCCIIDGRRNHSGCANDCCRHRIYPVGMVERYNTNCDEIAIGTLPCDGADEGRAL